MFLIIYYFIYRFLKSGDNVWLVTGKNGCIKVFIFLVIFLKPILFQHFQSILLISGGSRKSTGPHENDTNSDPHADSIYDGIDDLKEVEDQGMQCRIRLYILKRCMSYCSLTLVIIECIFVDFLKCDFHCYNSKH